MGMLVSHPRRNADWQKFAYGQWSPSLRGGISVTSMWLSMLWLQQVWTTVKKQPELIAAAGDFKVDPKKGFFWPYKDASLKENKAKRADWLFLFVVSNGVVIPLTDSLFRTSAESKPKPSIFWMSCLSLRFYQVSRRQVNMLNAELSWISNKVKYFS